MSTLAPPVMESSVAEHLWELRLEEFEEGRMVRQFECVACGAVRFE